LVVREERWLLTKLAQSADIFSRLRCGPDDREGRREKGPEAVTEALPALRHGDGAPDWDGKRKIRSYGANEAGVGGLPEEDIAEETDDRIRCADAMHHERESTRKRWISTGVWWKGSGAKDTD
jgi:hypothetical protein